MEWQRDRQRGRSMGRGKGMSRGRGANGPIGGGAGAGGQTAHCRDTVLPAQKCNAPAYQATERGTSLPTAPWNSLFLDSFSLVW